MRETRSYRVLPERSRLWARVRATLQEIEVEARDFEGRFDFPVESDRIVPSASAKGEIRIGAEAFDGGSRLFNRDLGRTLEARKFPAVVGELTEVQAGKSPGECIMRGELRLRGERSQVEGRVRVDYPDPQHIRLVGESSFEIASHGIKPRRLLVLSVEPQVHFFGDLLAERCS